MYHHNHVQPNTYPVHFWLKEKARSVAQRFCDSCFARKPFFCDKKKVGLKPPKPLTFQVGSSFLIRLKIVRNQQIDYMSFNSFGCFDICNVNQDPQITVLFSSATNYRWDHPTYTFPGIFLRFAFDQQ